jgi:hypothetical protein
MQIINLLDPETHDIETPLRTMALSADRQEAFRGQRLLELVQHLQAQGPVPRACVQLLLRELWLRPYNHANRVLVKIWVDWRDYSPLQEGLPEAHYRLQIQRGKAPLSRDARASTPEEAEQVIWEAFGWG